MRDFRKQQVWDKSHRLVLEVYRVSMRFPREELYGLTSQLRRAAVSVPANIAEGCGRDSVPDLARFFHIAMGSASEVEYELMLAHDLSYLADEDHQRLQAQVIEVKRMLTAYIQKLKG